MIFATAATPIVVEFVHIKYRNNMVCTINIGIIVTTNAIGRRCVGGITTHTSHGIISRVHIKGRELSRWWVWQWAWWWWVGRWMCG